MPCDQVGDARLQDLFGRQTLHSGNRPSFPSVAGQAEGQQLAPNTVEAWRYSHMTLRWCIAAEVPMGTLTVYLGHHGRTAQQTSLLSEKVEGV